MGLLTTTNKELKRTVLVASILTSRLKELCSRGVLNALSDSAGFVWKTLLSMALLAKRRVDSVNKNKS